MWGKLNRLTWGGVETFWAEGPAPLTAAITFRVGAADETLPTRGITHMVEHLALQPLGRQPYDYNGVVDHLRTTFAVTGSQAEVVGFLSAVTDTLGNLPLDRLEHERQILLTEAEHHGSGPLDWSLAISYGPRGPGLSAHEEFGLHGLTAEDVATWAARYFHADNAVLWMTGPPPIEAAFEVAGGGSRADVSAVELVVMKRPAWYEVADRGLTMTSVIRRSTAASALRSVLEHRLQAGLRYERGISYATGAVYMPLGPEVALQAVVTDVLKENLDQARDVILSTIDHLASDGPSDEEMTRYVAEMERAWNEPAAVAAILDSISVNYLLKPQDVERDVLEEARSIEPAAVGQAADDFRCRCVVGVPVGSKMPKRFHKVPDRSDKKVKGKTYQPTRRSETALTHHRLIQGDEGVTLIQDRGQYVTVRYDACEGLIRWSDGGRVLYGSDGFLIRIHPNDWRNGKRVIAELDRHLGRRAVDMRTEPPPHAPARWDAGTYLRWALVSAFFGFGAIANLFDPEYQADGSWSFYLVMALILVPVSVYNARKWFVTRKT